MTFPPQDIFSAVPLKTSERRDPLDLQRAETVEKGHGWIEIRRIAVRTVLPLRLGEKWPGINAICRIERIRELKTHCSREVIYAITSLPADKLAPPTLLQLARDHWQIENGLFHIRDVTFREDACRVRPGAAPEALADIRNAALNLIRGQKLKPREAFAASKWTAIRLVMTS